MKTEEDIKKEIEGIRTMTATINDEETRDRVLQMLEVTQRAMIAAVASTGALLDLAEYVGIDGCQAGMKTVDLVLRTTLYIKENPKNG